MTYVKNENDDDNVVNAMVIELLPFVDNVAVLFLRMILWDNTIRDISWVMLFHIGHKGDIVMSVCGYSHVPYSLRLPLALTRR
jgi:hypothetical protein